MGTWAVRRIRVQSIQEGFMMGDVDAPLVASQTFKEGAILNYAANGGIQELPNNAGVNLAGIAEEEAVAGAAFAKKVAMSPIRVGILLEANLATAASGISLVNSMIGQLAGFVKHTDTGHWVVDPGQTQKHGRIVGFGKTTDGAPTGLPPAAGDVYGRVLVAPLAGTNISGGAQIAW